MLIFSRLLNSFVKRWENFSSSSSFVSEQLAVSIQVIPCPKRDIKSELSIGTESTDSMNNSSLFKAVNNYICDIKELCTSLLSKVKVENVFFVWCEALKIGPYSPLKLQLNDLLIDNTDYPDDAMRYQEGTRNEKTKGNPLAVIVYECCDSKCIKPFYRGEQDKACQNNYREDVLRFQSKEFCPISDIHRLIIDFLYVSNDRGQQIEKHD